MSGSATSDLVDLMVVVHARTDRAVLVSDDGDEERAVWLPLSQIEIAPRGDGYVDLTCPERLALDRGLI